jgi:hypothetical protein
MNGRLPQSDLARIKGNGWLRKDAAAAWNAMAAAAAKDGVDLSIWESSMRRTYRPYASQVMARNYWCGQGRCGNAAVPGTSNHGLGTTVDLMNMTQRRWIDRHGAHFGWSKSWSDASWEWWHIRFRPGIWKPTKPKVDKLAPLTKHERFLVNRLAYHRKQMAKEARSGKGPRYHQQLKWARWYKSEIKKQMAAIARVVRANHMNWKPYKRGIRYQILLRAYRNTL